MIVTGASGAMGSEIVRAFSGTGAHIVSVDIADTEPTTTSFPRAIAMQADVTSVDDVHRVVGAVINQFSKIDVLINNAGTFRAVGALWQADPEVWWRDVTTNLFGPFLFSREVLPFMIGRNKGVIVNLSGGGFGSAVPGGSGYTSSKLALIRMTQVLALELGDLPSEHGIRGEGHEISTFGIEPAFVRGAMNSHVAASDGGRRWLPFVREWLERGETRDPIEVGEAIRELVELEPRELNGLTFSFDADFERLVRDASELRAAGACQARYVLPPPP